MSTSTTTSPTLIARVHDPQDAAAWATFEGRYGDLIVRYCRRRGLNAFDADDVRQLVLVRLLRVFRTGRYDPVHGRFRAFLGRIVVNEIARFRRRPKGPTIGVYPADADVAGGPAAADADWEQEWVAHHLRLAMRRLRETHDARSLAVFERLLAGGSVEDAASEFGMTPAAVQKVKQRVRDGLSERIAEQIRDEEIPRAGAPGG